MMKYDNVPVKVAAAYLNVSIEFIRTGIENGTLSFGACVTGQSGRRSFYISPVKLIKFKNN